MTTNNNKKKSSAARKLIPAIGMLTVSAMMLSSSTYAWFTMNKTVQVTGMELKTRVGSNLLICADNVEANYSSVTLSEGRKALLEPVSSVTGKTGSFFYTTDADATGQKVHGYGATAADAYKFKAYSETTPQSDANAGKTKYDANFNAAYEKTVASTAFGTAYGYVDYVFYLKATADATGQELRVTNCDLRYNDGTDGSDDAALTDNAWRVAFFATKLSDTQGGEGNTGEEGSAGAAVGAIDPAAGESTTAKSILKFTGATNFTGTNAVKATSGEASAVYGAATYGSPAVLATLGDAGSVEYYKVTCRVWLEGEDNTCNSTTYAALQDGSWKLDMEIKLSADDTEDQAIIALGNNTFVANTDPVQTNPATPVEP